MSLNLRQATLGETPEALDAVDVAAATSELIRPMMDSQVLGVADIDQTVVATPPVRMNDRFHGDATANNGLERDLFAIRDDLRVALAVTFQQSEDDGLARRATSTLATHAASDARNLEPCGGF